MRFIHISREGQNLGSFSEEQIPAMIQSGQLLRTDFAWAEGMASWQPLASVINLGPDMGPVPPAMPHAPPMQSGPVPMAQLAPQDQTVSYASLREEPVREIRWKPALFFSIASSIMVIALVWMLYLLPADDNGRGMRSWPSSGNQPTLRYFIRTSTDEGIVTKYIEGIGPPLIISGWVLALLLDTVFITMLYYRCWRALPREYRSLGPGLAVGLMFIPLFNVFWQFFAFIKLANGYQRWAVAKSQTRYPRRMGSAIRWRAFTLAGTVCGFLLVGHFEMNGVVSTLLTCMSFAMGYVFFKGIIQQAHEMHGLT